MRLHTTTDAFASRRSLALARPTVPFHPGACSHLMPCCVGSIAPIHAAMRPQELRVLVFAETGRHWTARALEHDIAVQGRSIDGAIDALVKIVRAHVAFD